jgi:minor histocompatibility antigen H13
MTNKLLLASNATIFLLWAASPYILIPYVVNLLMLVTCILYSACHFSLLLREEQALARGEKDPTKTKEEQDSTPLPLSETLTSEDAMQFPIVGSCSLFGLYCCFKFFDKDTVNLILSGYFSLMGCGAVTSTVSPVISSIVPGLADIKFKKEIKIPHFLPEMIGGESPWEISLDFTMADIVAFIGSAIFSVYYFMKKNWVMNNVLGICFCLKGIEKFSLGTYKIGAILLVGLFFYDIFWVFGTEVMVTVAKSLDGPIKILFPRTLVPDAVTGKIELSLLGLGDIVIPGFFLSLLLRFDAHNANVPCFPTNVHANFPKPYFHSCLVGYFIGMATTMFVMIKFQAAQPALLYLVPGCLLSSFLTAVVKGEVKTLLAYSEEVEEEEEEEKKEVDDKKND